MVKRLTIAICTYDRPMELNICLNSIKEFIGEYKQRCDVLVVDNQGNEKIRKLAEEYKSFYEVSYMHCKEIGLCNARNMAAFHSNGFYICYLDDDTKILENTMLELFKVIDNFDFDIFGGNFSSFYIDEKPKWIPPTFGCSKYKQTSIGLTDQSIIGLLFIMKSKLIHEIQFDPKYGMKAKATGYGDETYYQEEAMKMGYSVGFNPNLKVLHLVGKHKLSVLWHLKSYYYHGVYSNFHLLSFSNKVIRASKDVFFFIPAAFYFSFKNYLRNENYFIENLFLDSFSNILVFVGRLISLIKFK